MDTNNFIINDSYYCIRINNKGGITFGNIPDKIHKDNSKSLYLIMKTNKKGGEIRVAKYDKGNRPPNGSIWYDEQRWKVLDKAYNDETAEIIVKLLGENDGK